MTAEPLAERLARQIATEGPITSSAFIDAALYDPVDGFYGASAAAGRAGRRGDFLTSAEVGPLFGAVIARAVDHWWQLAGQPSRFRVEEHGAGPGTLARAVLLAAPDVLTAGALQWDLVEQSAGQRAAHPEHPALRSLGVSAAEAPDVVVANELLDNLPFDIVRFDGTVWRRIDVGLHDDRFIAVDGAEVAAPPAAAGAVRGATLPVHYAARDWIAGRRVSGAKRVVVFDYGAPTAELLGRGGGWLRTFRGHGEAGDWLAAPGTCDITSDLALEQLCDDATVTTQAEWLRGHGIDDLVAEGRAIWEAGASVGDLAAIRGRSRIGEAEALLDPDGLGGFMVLEWVLAAAG